MRLPFLHRRVRFAFASAVTFGLTLASVLAPAIDATASGAIAIRAADSGPSKMKLVFVRN